MVRVVAGVIVGLIAGWLIRGAVEVDETAASTSAGPTSGRSADVARPEPTAGAATQSAAARSASAGPAESDRALPPPVVGPDAAQRTETAAAAAANPIRLPDSHRGFVEREQMQLPDAHAELEREAQDVEWAEVVERRLYEFLTTHPSGANIGVVSLVCRTTRCEIAGSVYGEAPQQTWRTVRTDLMAQPWYSTYLSRSIMESSADFTGELRFVAIISRVGTDVPSPVPQ